MRKIGLEKVIEGGGRDGCDGFEGVGEVQGNCIDQEEEVDRRAERRLPRSAYRRGSLSLNGLMGDGAIDPYQNLRHCDCDDVSRLLGVKVSTHEMRSFGAVLTVVAVDERERHLALNAGD